METITIKSNKDRDFQIEELQIDIATLNHETNENIKFLDFARIEILSKTISARSKAIQMWYSGVADVNVTI